MNLYPQIPRAVAEQLADERRALSIGAAAALAAIDHPDAEYTPTGGTRVDEPAVSVLRAKLVSAAEAHGYPKKGDGLAFDKPAAEILYTGMGISPAEASKPGVWEFLSCVVLPDLVRWRFPGDASGTPLERILASRRNTFQRLWWRAWVFREDGAADPCLMLGLLGEDEIVQVMERPLLAGSRGLSRAMAKGLLAAAQANPGVTRRELMREAQKKIRRLAAFSSFEGVTEDSLTPLVGRVFEQVAAVAR